MSNIYMKIPGVEGNVSADPYQGWIALEHISFSVTRHMKTVPGKTVDREGSRPAFSELEATKRLDNASNTLFQYACVGNAFSEIEIHICTTGSHIQPYGKYKIYNVMVAEHSHNVAESSLPLETLRLNFTKIHITYIGYDASNQPTSPDITGYDLTTAQLT